MHLPQYSAHHPKGDESQREGVAPKLIALATPAPSDERRRGQVALKLTADNSNDRPMSEGADRSRSSSPLGL
jgi:hypothetical protein